MEKRTNYQRLVIFQSDNQSDIPASFVFQTGKKSQCQKAKQEISRKESITTLLLLKSRGPFYEKP